MSLSPTGRIRAANVFAINSPSVSPGRAQRLIDEGVIHADDPAYKSAMDKIYNASWKFDRGKSSDLLKTLDNKELFPDQFRQILRAGMNCKFTNEEFEAIFPVLNNNGYVDGTEFLMMFYRFRYEHRSKLLTARVDTDRRHREMLKAVAQKKKEEFDNRRRVELTTDYTAEDEKSALEKIVNAAVKYDRLMPGAVPLDAFDIEKLNPGEFREQMKMVFRVNLSIPELSAFIAYFNRDKEDPSDQCINCASFLVTFFRMGFNEKSRRLHEEWAEKKRIAEEKERKKQLEAEELAKKNALKVNFTFTDEDKERAIVKLRTAAKLYDKTTPGAMSMKAFEVKEMPPHIFKEQLKRIFNLNVTPAEMGALMSVFDCNGDGVITCEEFTKVFINMGFEEREKELKAAIAKQKEHDQKRQEAIEKKRAALESKNSLKVSYEYTDEEFTSAMQKLVEAAWRFDKNMPGAASLDAFEAQYMEPHVLKDQLKKAFFMKVTPQELGAIMHHFDPDNSGRIHCATFLKKFFRVGYEERNRRKELWREHQKELIAKRLEEEKKKMDALNAKNNIVLGHTLAANANKAATAAAANDPNGSGDADDVNPSLSTGAIPRDFTEKDFQNAFFKLTMGAIKYDRALPNAMNLTAFECISMPPHIFREQLKLTFNVKVNIHELWALMSYFDPENTGEINCKKFITQFLRTGYEERNRIKDQWRHMKLVKDQQQKQREQDIIREKEMLAFKECDFDFTEDDFNSALFRFVSLCHTIDKRTIGPAGLIGFQSESLNPAEFREMLKRTFNFKVTSRELGALVNYFDINSRKVVHCSTFLNTFTQIRAQCEEFKGKPDEQERLLQHAKQLKDAYIIRMARNPSVEARPWRQQNSLTSYNGNKKVFKRREVKPLTGPMEKYRLRVFIGRKTLKMDLATKEIWPRPQTGAPGSPSPSRDRRSKEGGEGSPMGPLSSSLSQEDHFPLEETKEGANGASEQPQIEDTEIPQPPLTVTEAEGAEGAVTGAVSTDSPVPLASVSVDDEAIPLFADTLNTVNRLGSPSSRNLTAEGGDSITPRSATRDPSLNGAVDDDGQSVPSLKDKTIVIPKKIPNAIEIEFRLNIIPKEILRITELRELWLCNHSISLIPSGIKEMKLLQVLSLKNNHLEILPSQLCELSNLQRLYLSKNQLHSLPNQFFKLKSLIELDLSSNQFHDFPEVLTNLTSLNLLDMSQNQLTDLPKTMVRMKSLNLLFVNHNSFDLNNPPMVLAKLPALTVQGCPIPIVMTNQTNPDGTITSINRAAKEFIITPGEEFELMGLIKGRAAASITSKLRRRKKRSNYLT